MKRKPDFIMPTEDEDARINVGIADDPDNPELTAMDFTRAASASRAQPDLVRDYERRVRGPQKAPTKKQVSIRLDQDVIERLKSDGPGWQRRANDLLRKAVGIR
ncbi:BrnA antitoxin family protein [Komagataeibacter saccharivorans]|uniref:BrnA antitoxin family protein n=1 Tax=Komagataeibacter saccharivorans TaxID=265959 RepID=UPI0039ECF737